MKQELNTAEMTLYKKIMMCYNFMKRYVTWIMDIYVPKITKLGVKFRMPCVNYNVVTRYVKEYSVMNVTYSLMGV